MDARLRRNEICIVGQPRCDYVFSSSRHCFIAYPFRTSQLEVTIIKTELEKQGIEPIEAGPQFSMAGANAFCTKICSKIIQAQFCVAFLNQEPVGDGRAHNANVMMEYGLMLGFNKYVIPFQPISEPIPFNVSGLDTIKYSPDQFQDLARTEISKAIERTAPTDTPAHSARLEFEQFLAQHNAVISTGFDDGERLLQDRAQPFRALLANSFSGLKYMYVLFTEEQGSESTLWRVKRLKSVLDSLPENARTRATLGLAQPDSVQLVHDLLRSFEIWIICRDLDEARDLRSTLNDRSVERVRLFLLEDIGKCSRASLRGEELSAAQY